MNCTKCDRKIKPNEKFHRTKLGHHHSNCGEIAMELINKVGKEINEKIANANSGSKEEYAILEILQKINERIDLIAFELKKRKGWIDND